MYSRQPPRRSVRGENDGAVRSTRKPRIFRFLPGVLLGLVLTLLALVGTSRPASAASAASAVAEPTVDVVALNSAIDAGSQRFITNAISTAEHDGSQALVIEINTPGGAIDSLQAITTAELNSTVPIITYVTPSGAYAASAGAFVTLAAPIAAMAPSTTIGATVAISTQPKTRRLRAF